MILAAFPETRKGVLGKQQHGSLHAFISNSESVKYDLLILGQIGLPALLYLLRRSGFDWRSPSVTLSPACDKRRFDRVNISR